MIEIWILSALAVAPGLFWLGQNSRTMSAWIAASLAFLAFLFFALTPLPLPESARYFSMMIAGVGAAVFVFCSELEADEHVISLLWVFGVAMVCLVCADSFLGFVAGWEGVSLCGYFLVRQGNIESAKKVFQVTGLLGLLTPFGIATLPFAPKMGCAMIIVGCMGKSALFPFSGWLTQAMRAATPVSAFLHSATLVQAGLFVLHRYAPVIDAEGLRPFVEGVGYITLAFAFVRFVISKDAKEVLAWSTVGALGVGAILSQGPSTTFWLFTLAHALYKAPLFMIAGYLEKICGHRDWQRWDNIRVVPLGVRITAWVVSWVAIGLPFSLTAAAKSEIGPVIWLFSLLSVWACLRIAIVPTLRSEVKVLGKHGLPALALATTNLALGLRFGFGSAAVLIVVALAVFGSYAVGPLRESIQPVSLGRFALPRIRGSQTRWLAAGFGLISLAAGITTSEAPPLPWFFPICLILIATMAVGVTLTESFPSALVVAGSVGAISAALFALGGGPDLALTQILVEGLSLALVAAFVLRRTRPVQEEKTSETRLLAALIAGVGATILTMGLMLNQTPGDLAEQFTTLALQAHAKNVVNGILVDFRAMDTLGEIAVLSLAVAFLIALGRGLRRTI